MKKILFSILLCTTFAITTFASKINVSATEVPASITIDEPFEITLRFDIPKGFHIYPNKTEAGMPTTIQIYSPKNAEIKNLIFPKAKEFNFMGMKSLGYSAPIDVKATVVLNSFTNSGQAEISLKASWLKCSDTCVPEEQIVSIKIPVVNSEKSSPLLAAIFGAILGGLILNVMPCVFPVISLKIMSFAKSSGDSKVSIIFNSLIFSLGIIATFAVLGVALALLKSSAGWGMQLQHPFFTSVMMGIFWLLALNFLGVWEFGVGISASASTISTSDKNKFVASFLSGVLAVLVASPCVAPFMASAVGFALTGNASPFESVAIITSVGLGMAIPYICFAMFPSLLKKLPRPGRWLEILKKVLSIPMFITVVWLAWVGDKQNSGLVRTLLMLSSLTVIAVIWRYFMNPFQPLKKRIIAMCCCVVILFFGVCFYPIPDYPDRPELDENDWSQKRVEELQKQGYAVFVDFTARWCLTCQYNKQILHSDEINELFKKHNVKILVADCTNKNSSITQELKNFGRAGVPLYLLYSPKETKPVQILPSILTKTVITEAIDKLKQ